MSTAATYLDLAARINEGHQARDGQSTLAVVPVIVDNLDHADAVAHCLTKLVGGSVLSSAAFSEDIARPTHGNVQLRVAVETVLTLPSPHGSRSVVVTMPDPETCSVSYPDAGAHSGGEVAMLGLARAMLSVELVAGELAVLIYDERGMDKNMLQACWSLLVDHLPGIDLGALRTVVALVGGRPRIDPHAQPKRGCQFAIADGRLQRRKPEDNAAGDALNFATARTRGRVLFLGAGFTASSRLPLGNDLRDTAIRNLIGEVGPSSGSGDTLAIRFRRWLSANQETLPPVYDRLTEEQFATQLTLEQVLAFEQERHPELPTLERFKEVHDLAVGAPGRAVSALAEMLRVPNGLVLVTVNFDELIEASAPGLVRVFASDTEFAEAKKYVDEYLAGRETVVPLLKLHGTISDPPSCVVTTTQTESGVSVAKRAAIASLQGTESEQTPWMYVGASMRDLDLRPIFADVAFGKSVDEGWVAPFPDGNVETFAASSRRRCWSPDRGLQARLVTEIADHFMELLAERWAKP